MSCGSTTCPSNPFTAKPFTDASADAGTVSRRFDVSGPYPRLVMVLDWIAMACERARQRRQLIELDDRLLDDIGLTREQAERAARKPFWRR